MNISNHQRILKLIKNLTTNPDLLVPYFKTSILSRKYPIEYPYPWWAFRAIERADEVLQNKRIFEYGTGGSTVRYAKVAKAITSVEDDKKWLEMVSNHVKQSSNVTLRYEPFNFKAPEGFQNSSYLHAVDSGIWDVVIIDGQDWTFKERLTCFHHAEPKMQPGGIIIVDDFWRYEELLANNQAKQIEVFESVGPCRIGVTSTAFFYY